MYIILLLIISTLACCGHVVYWALELSNKLDVSVLSLCKSSTGEKDLFKLLLASNFDMYDFRNDLQDERHLYDIKFFGC